MITALFLKILKKINLLFATVITLLIDFLIVKKIGFAFFPMLLMSIIFFAIAFLLGILVILLFKEKYRNTL